MARFTPKMRFGILFVLVRIKIFLHIFFYYFHCIECCFTLIYPIIVSQRRIFYIKKRQMLLKKRGRGNIFWNAGTLPRPAKYTKNLSLLPWSCIFLYCHKKCPIPCLPEPILNTYNSRKYAFKKKIIYKKYIIGADSGIRLTAVMTEYKNQWIIDFRLNFDFWSKFRFLTQI